ncbi:MULTISPECIES: DUF3810 domain-containing protein [Weeksella]|uniref:DUF3810 domain-containing protein n=1 Tax=Weeksella virosa (strain ATCC 43766 / DSM 16922 / JCM 21250 / CCUG 30538 / CDC 9751 / IAM 14551 / NBRC 16016 / NCTC 11634 / CL345/78) TaxID=865938 RepID=F0P094_WEEVC|nr:MULTISPECIES: DUF3810 domain-containing protein [Weeksella]ADX68454.1 hypothetical protein Weevi_1763 [Weeksella virosa DSM 16922]MDK7375484.1 DUF3810 domain-containing protein [Weeksella virosa]MDK7675374.1 DUF3810 domain-containing protein [Weeksella virosa]OFM84539.1 hypothetical protein HMPREF2660_08495 [Weeksella sp. HMSC059D05]SUP54788.1 Protein of uncharacterised function (DUF3810) [Weeksella virosa]
MLNNSNQRLITLLLLGAFQMIFFQILKSSPAFLLFYNVTIYPKINHLLLSIFSRISIPIGEIFYLLLGASLLFFLYRFSYTLVKKKYCETKNTLVYILLIGNTFFGFFQLFWGINYAKKSFTSDFYIDDVSIDELKSIAENELTLVKFYRNQVQENENGIFILQEDQKTLQENILSDQQQLVYFPFLKSKYVIDKNNFKPSFFSSLANYLGVLGYYNPFTNEANYNNKTTDLSRPFTLAHELAHLISYAPENEANFIAYLIAEQSKSIDLLYSAHYKTLMNALRNIAYKDPEYVKNILDNFSDGMVRDREHERWHAEKYLGAASDAFSNLNDVYLRANNQEGISSYSQYIVYVAAYYRWKNIGND